MFEPPCYALAVSQKTDADRILTISITYGNNVASAVDGVGVARSEVRRRAWFSIAAHPITPFGVPLDVPPSVPSFTTYLGPAWLE